MSFFDTMRQDDAVNIFNNADEFAEAVVYTKQNGTTRNINVQVWRMPPEQGETKTHRMRISVANSATYGITSAEVVPEADTITVAYRPGGTAKAYTLHLVTDPAQEHMDVAMNYFDLY